jgi:hypothetical protein
MFELTKRQLEQLHALGYRWTWSSRGHRVTFRGQFVGAAGVLPNAPRARGAAVRANANFERRMAHLKAWDDFQARHRNDPQSLEGEWTDADDR